MDSIRIIIEKDGEGYLAKLDGFDNIFAYGYTLEEALKELKNVMIMFIEEIDKGKDLYDKDYKLIKDVLSSYYISSNAV